MNFRQILIATSAVAAFGMAGPATAFAQETVTPPATMEAPAAQFTDDTLQSFAVAFVEVAKISQEYQPQVEGAATPEDQERVRNEAGERMVEAVQTVDGITVDEYTQIMQAAQTDPELAQRINTVIAQAAQE